MDDVFPIIPAFGWQFGAAFAPGLEYAVSPDALMKPLSDCKLYTFVDTAYLRGRSAESVARELCDGGSDIIQLRAKDSSEEQIRATAESILPICEQSGVRLVINDYPRIAFELSQKASRGECVGCHLGQEDFFDGGHGSVSDLRVAYGESRGRRASTPDVVPYNVGIEAVPHCFIGLSSHAPAQAERAVAAGADYIAIGPIYSTATKPTAKAVTLQYVRWAAANVSTPWFAIGGVNLATLDAVLEAGATRICVVSGILNADDVAGVCAEFRRRVG